jgi:hypothetical protein
MEIPQIESFIGAEGVDIGIATLVTSEQGNVLRVVGLEIESGSDGVDVEVVPGEINNAKSENEVEKRV